MANLSHCQRKHNSVQTADKNEVTAIGKSLTFIYTVYKKTMKG